MNFDTDQAIPVVTFRKRLLLGVLLINLFVCFLAGISLDDGKKQFQKQAEINTENLSQVLDKYTEGLIEKVDFALLALLDEYASQLQDGGVDKVSLTTFMSRQKSRLAQLDNIGVVDTQGEVVYDAGLAGRPKSNVLDRDYFIELRNNPQAGLVISKPLRGRFSGKWIVVFARRLNDQKGAFAGMAYAALDVDKYAQTLATLNVGKHGIVSLRDQRMGLVALYSEATGFSTDIGSQVISPQLQQLLKEGRTSGTYMAQTGLDQVERTVSFRQLGRWPFYVVVGLATDDYLAEWHSDVAKMGVLLLFFALISGLAGWLVYRSWQRQREARLFSETLVDSLPGVFFRIDSAGRLLAWNRNLQALIGPEGMALVAQQVLLVIHEDDRALAEERIRMVFERGYAELEARLLLANGSSTYFFFIGKRLLIDDRCYVLGTGIDISQRKQAEQTVREKTEALQRSNTDLEQFAYSVSHDMRQPLRMITGHLQLLERSLRATLNEDDRQNMAFALDGAKRMDGMIVSLLEYSRVGRKTESKRWMASRESLDEALGFLAPAIEESKAEITIQGEWPKLFASRDELTRLFQNLIGNALKYHNAAQVPQIEIEALILAEAVPPCWQVKVRDHGIGIDPNQIDRLFLFFSRLQSRSRFEGTGMGLALCRRIVEHYAGRIWVESAGEGLGSVFVFEIALTSSEGEAT